MNKTENNQNKTDEELVKLTLKNKAYFEYLIDRYEAKLLRYIKRITNVSQEEVEDILQESFIKAYYNLNDFDQGLKFSSWIYRITHNQVISNFRKNKARPQGNYTDVSEDALNNIVSEFNTIREIDRSILNKSIGKILENVDKRYREVLILKFLEEKDYKEISDILKKPMGTVATLISRGKEQFKKEFEKLNIEL